MQKFQKFCRLCGAAHGHGSSSLMMCHACHHVGGRRHTPVVCNEGTNQIPATKKGQTKYQPLRSRPIATKRPPQKSQLTTRVAEGKEKTLELIIICNRFLQTHLCHSQFLEHRPHCRSVEPLKSVVSKSYRLVDRHANDRAIYRDA